MSFLQLFGIRVHFSLPSVATTMICPFCSTFKTHYTSGRRNWSQEQWARWNPVVTDLLGNVTKNCCSACSDHAGWYWRSDAGVPREDGCSRHWQGRGDADTGSTTISAREVMAIKEQRGCWLKSNIHCHFWDRFVDHVNEQCQMHHSKVQMENTLRGRHPGTDLLDLLSRHGGIACRQYCPISADITVVDRRGRLLFQPNPECLARAFRPIWASSKLSLFGTDYDIWLAVIAFMALHAAMHLGSERVDQRVLDFATALDLLCWASWLWDEYYEARTA